MNVVGLRKYLFIQTMATISSKKYRNTIKISYVFLLFFIPFISHLLFVFQIIPFFILIVLEVIHRLKPTNKLLPILVQDCSLSYCRYSGPFVIWLDNILPFRAIKSPQLGGTVFVGLSIVFKLCKQYTDFHDVVGISSVHK